MDDTSAAFIGDERLNYIPIVHTFQNYPEMHLENFFRQLKPLDGAIEGINKLIDSDLFEIYILSVPLHSSPHSYSEKVQWIHEHLPRLSDKIIFTQNKGIIAGDYLIDDSQHWKEVWEKSNKKAVGKNCN
jgi:5'(3')-deoxyribonucleotidase